MKDALKTDTSVRFEFPDDEQKFPWLPMLLDAYATIDHGIATAIKEEEEKRSIKLACREGCDNCCRKHMDIPAYPLELVGIYWYCAEKMAGPLRGVLKKQLLNHEKGGPCPFLIEGSCSVHPLRFTACRQFNVFGRRCDEGEDPYYTRRDDVLTPIEDYTNQAFYIMLPFYGITEEAERVQAIKDNFIHTQVSVLQSLDWKKLVKVMDGFDSKG